LGYDLDRAVQIFKPLSLIDGFAFYVASPTRSIQHPALMNPLQRGTRSSFLSATEKSCERAMVDRSAIVNR
jgi:hypothetical protein